MSFRQLAKHILIYGSSVWAGKAIGFIMIPVYTRALTTSDYGVLDLASRTTDIVAMVLGFGLAAALIRFQAEAKEPDERERVIRTAIVSAGMVGFGAACLLGLAAGPISSAVFGTAKYGLVFRLALIGMGLELATMTPLALLRIHERSALFAGLNLGRLVLALSLNIQLVVVRHMGVIGVFTSNLIGVSLLLLILIAATRRYWRPQVDFAILRRMLSYSLPLVPASLAMFVLNFGDRFFLRTCCGLGVLGVYALGYKVCLVMPAIVMEPQGLAWSAIVFDVAKRPDAGRIYDRFFNGYLFCVVFFSVALAALSRDIVGVMAESSYRNAWRIVPVVLLAFSAWSTVSIFETGVLIEKKSYYRTFACLIAGVVAMVGYAILIPRFGAMGAAWATVMGFAAMAASTYAFSAKVHPIPYNLRRAGMLLALGALTYGAGALVPGVGLISALGRVLVVSVMPVVLYVAGYFDPENVTTVMGVLRARRSKEVVRETTSV